MSGGEVGRGKSAARRSSGTRNTPCRFQNHAFPARHEVAAAQPPGSTGPRPVPSGDPPLGTGSAHELFPAPLANGCVPVIPSGQWPDGTGW